MGVPHVVQSNPWREGNGAWGGVCFFGFDVEVAGRWLAMSDVFPSSLIDSNVSLK
jgi:hypothetical protein